MGPRPDEITQNLAERWCWESARREDSRVARRLYRKHLVDGVYRLDEGALLDGFFHFLQALGVMALLKEVHGAAIHRELLPVGQSVLRYGMKPVLGIQRRKALPRLLCSDEAVMLWVGCKAQHVRQGERLPGPLGPDTLAQTIMQWHLRDSEMREKGDVALNQRRVSCTKSTPPARITDTWTPRRQTRAVPITPTGCAENIGEQGYTSAMTRSAAERGPS